jgi:hypothetical protein
MLACKYVYPALLALCVLGCEGPTRIEQLTFEDPIERVEVDSGSGEIIVVAEADREHIDVEAVIRGNDTRIEWAIEDGTLQLTHDCPPRSWSSCTVDWYVWVPRVAPAGIDLDLESGSGDIMVDDLIGSVRAATGSGDVRLHDTVGLVFDAETGSGDVTLTRCEADDVESFTGSGDVEVSLVSRPRRVALETGSGDATLTVPDGAYRLDLDAGSGHIDVHGLSQDSDADSLIQISTGSGDIAVHGS